MSFQLQTLLARATALSAGAACAVLGLTACGNTKASASVSTRAFRADANSVCVTYSHEVNVLSPPIGLAGIAAYGEKRLALSERRLSMLRGLTAPSSQRVVFARYLSNLAAYDRLVARAGALVKRRDRALLNRHARREAPQSLGVPGQAELLRSGEHLAAMLKAEATALGFTRCVHAPEEERTYDESSENAG